MLNFSPVDAIIIDIDGTLANCHHRLHHLPNWDAFFGAMENDQPIWPVIELAVAYFSSGWPIILCSGRPEQYRRVTEDWLSRYDVPYSVLYMRPTGDHRPDTQVKRDILSMIRNNNIYNPVLAVDDRPCIVKMWREEGLICLANEWHGDKDAVPSRAPHLTIMVGPSGAGKSTYLASAYETCPHQIISSDGIRQELCGNFLDQTKNDEVFAALHALVKARLWAGLDVIVDATNIRNRDRRAITDLAPPNASIEYIVINRSMEEKYKSAGWRTNLPFDLIAKHEQTFNSNLKDILNGDGLPNVQVRDLRK